ncbi:S41 family peptidase [Brevundimonas sp.]|jgi:carboxyl-terminal processing protease|uniref:S41 family peptidase n=1 Tax=Brevundimonas sp. TaxID=1871086 RepID=UPI0037848C67
MFPATRSLRLPSPRRPAQGPARGLALILAGVLALAGGVPAVAGELASTPVVVAAPLDRARAEMNQRVFDRVWSEVRTQYYDPAIHGLDWTEARRTYRPDALAARDDGQLYRVIDQMLDLLDDDHAGAAPPAVARRQDAQRRRRAVMGVTLYPQDGGGYRIDRVRPGSPAEAAGVRVGWRLAGDGSGGWSPDREVVDGRPLTLAFTDTEGVRRDVTLTPREMDPLPAFVADRSRPDVLVLRIEGFEPGLGRWMGAQLADLSPDTAVVLDMRDNPGGLLMEADAVLSCFLPDRMAWATRTNRSGRSATLRVQEACGGRTEPATNALAVLVDGSSRSAAELTPAALQEAGRAIVVGERTAGAVLISQDTPLPDGGRLTLSRADFVTAGGVRLEKRGVDPDLVVADAEGEPGAADEALLAAIAALRTTSAAVGARPDVN